MLRETDPQTTIWELLLPDEAKRLPAELAQVDAYLDDERFVAPWRALFDRRLGRPSVPVDTLLRLHPTRPRQLSGRPRRDYLLVVKANQPALHAQLAGLPWRQIPVMDHTCDHGHGRIELRTLKVAAAGLCFPHAAQAIQVIRRVRAPGSRRWRTVTVYAVTSLALGAASPAQLAGWLRGHWRIENRLHWVSATWTSAKTPPRRAAAASPA